MSHTLSPKRLRILWRSKYHAHQYFISVNDGFNETDNISGYAKLVHIEVLIFLI